MLLLLGMVGGLFGKYPFGGMMRHQMLLLLFAPLAAWTALDTVRTRARSPAGRALALALALAAVGVSATATARHIARARHVTWPGVAEMERDFGAEAAIHVDQFNLIGFFMSAHDWRWSYRGPLGPPGVEAYLLTRDGRSRTLIAHRERWNADPYEPGLYRDIATASHVAGAPCGVLFVARQQPFDVPPSAEQMRLLSRAAGLELGRTQLTRSLVLGRLCAGDTPASGGPRVDRVVPAFAKAGVPFQVQPDGYSALSIEGAGFRPGAVVVLAGRPLTTVFGNSGWITATVPPELSQRPGRLELRVVDPERGPSAAASFEVRP
jgi:hypothetical protein